MPNKEDKPNLEKIMFELVRRGTTDFKINGDILTEDDSFDIVTVMMLFQIDISNTAKIVRYLKKLMKDHKGSAADILREVYHNMTGHEKYFAAYILGKNFKVSFSKIGSAKELEIFLNPYESKLDLSNLSTISEYVFNIIKQEKPGVTPAYSIKKIIESNFEENDKIFTVFYYALMWRKKLK